MDFGKVNNGFSLIELIVTIIILAIVAAYALPRLNLISIKNQGFYDQAMSSIRYGQKRAIATGCIVEVDITSTVCNLNWVGCASNSAISNPSNNDTDFCKDSEPEGSVSSGNFHFDRVGRPMDTGNNVLTSAQIITIGTRELHVEAQTGFAHEP